MFDAEHRWMKLWGSQEVPSAMALVAYGRLRQAYGGSNRLYHNMGHIRHCLDVYDSVKNLALLPEAMEAAVWFHDVCYNTTSSTNEEDSVAWASITMKSFGVPSPFIKNVSELIMATKNHDGQLTEPDEQLIADIDLSSLGVAWDRFSLATQDIRNEYSHVDGREFARKRAEILRKFLTRPFIYYTPELKERFERQARANLTRSIAQLWGQAAA